MTKVTLHKCKRARAPTKNGAPRSRTFWMLRWYGTDGCRYGEVIGGCDKLPKRDAEARRREKQSKLDCGVVRPDRPRRNTLADFLQQDREAVSIDMAPRSIVEMKTAARHAAAVLGDDFDLHKVNAAAVGRIKKYLSDKGRSPATIRKINMTLQGAFSRGIGLGLVTTNPFLPRSRRRPYGVRLPKVQQSPVRIYKRFEIDALLAVAPSKWWATYIRLAFTSGLRQGEVLNLMWSDIDLEVGTVTVRGKKAGTFTIRDQTYPILPWTSKTYEARTVPIPAETVDALRDFRTYQEPPRSAYAFLSLDRLTEIGRIIEAKGAFPPGHKLVTNLMREWVRIQDAARDRLSEGADEPYEWQHRTIHDLRRTYGTAMARYIALHELKALLGHSSIKTTDRYYLAVGDDLGKRIETAFGSGQHQDNIEAKKA